MSTFLEIVQAVRRGATLQGEDPSSISDLVGPEANIPDFVNDVWNDIQTYTVPGDGQFWRWQRRTQTFSADPSEDAYTLDYIFDVDNSEPPSSTPPTGDVWDGRFKKWKKNPTLAAESTEVTSGEWEINTYEKTRLIFVEYDLFVQRETNNEDASKPRFFTIRPQDNALILNKLEKYTQVWIDYQLGPQVLVNDTDVPEMPDYLHQLIIHGAIIKTANQFGNSIKAQEAAQDYAKMWGDLLRQENPKQRMYMRSLA